MTRTFRGFTRGALQFLVDLAFSALSRIRASD